MITDDQYHLSTYAMTITTRSYISILGFVTVDENFCQIMYMRDMNGTIGFTQSQTANNSQDSPYQEKC